MSKQQKPRVLYIVYWGAAEPLGQSLVLPAVHRLAALGAELTLVTFEKPADLERKEQIESIRESLNKQGVRWLPLKYHKRPKVPATAFDIAQACARAIMVQVRGHFDIIHGRTFIGGLAGLVLAPILRAQFVYHNEGFYPDEQVDGGVWQAGSTPHRIAKRLEQKMYTRADGVIALSYRAKCDIEKLLEGQSKKKPVIVVSSCVDLDRFHFHRTMRQNKADALRLVYIGAVGGRYLLNRIGRFVTVASQEIKGAHLRVLTRTNPDLIKNILSASGLAESGWSLDTVPHTEMPAQLAQSDAGLFFLTQGISEHGCSPTKIGEYWAMGLPVVTTPNVSDTDEIIRRERVGIIVEDHTDAEYLRAARELRALLDDDQLSLRCRRAAENHYALEPACERQISLYRELTPYESRAATGAQASESRNS